MSAVAACSLAITILLMWSKPRGAKLLVKSNKRESSCRLWVRRLLFVFGVGVVAFFLPQYAMWAGAGAVLAATSWHLAMHRRAVKQRVHRRADIVAACQGLASQLKVGQIPATAVARASIDSPALAEAAAAQQVGADVATALRMQAEKPGQAGLLRLASAWELCEMTGASLVGAASHVAESLRQEQSRMLAVEAELAAPRATGRLLSCLPVFGVGMGYVAGGDPLHFLFVTPVGRWCVAAAVILSCIGLLWTERLAQEPS